MFDFGDDRLPARFWAKVQPDEATGCWVWMGGLNGGYGLLRFEGHTASAHRVAYQTLTGPIPSGLTLDHLCRVRACVNPHHLEPVTRVENIRRGDAGRARREWTHCMAGHPFDAVNTYRFPNGKRACKACHRIWGRVSDRRRRAKPAP